MTDSTPTTAAPTVTVQQGEWAWGWRCSCGQAAGGFADNGDATRAGATHLYRGHGIYAGGHKPTMDAMEDE